MSKYQLYILVILVLSAGSAKRYLLSKNETDICEVLEFSDEPRSWFIGNSVQRGTCVDMQQNWPSLSLCVVYGFLSICSSFP